VARVAVPSCIVESIQPGIEKSYRVEAGQPANGLVALADRGAALLVTEEIAGHEAKLVQRLNPAAHRAPEAIYQKAGDLGCGGPLQPDLRLTVVEEEVPRLVALDVLEQRGEHRVSGARGQQAVAPERGQPVDSAPPPL